MRVGAYVLGEGPSTLTVLMYEPGYRDDYFAEEAAREGTTKQKLIQEVRQYIETAIGDISGREEIMFVGPPSNLSVEVWNYMGAWDVQRREDGKAVAVHPDRGWWRRYRPDEYQTYRSVLEMELLAFTQAMKTANEARVADYGGRIGADPTLPMLVTDAHQLRQFYIDVGAYDHPDGPPAQPPPVR